MSLISEEFKPYEEDGTWAPIGDRRAKPQSSGYVPFKLCAEWILALVLLILASPLCLFLACLVKLSSRGPAFYAQSRLGLNSKVFRIYKFRTMVQDAEHRTGPVWASKNDCRITPVGNFLRSTHLDELPQLWNVLRGEMSLIGPRPERPELAARISRQIPEFRERLAVRPGITGLAQLLLPADDPNDAALQCVKEKLAHDRCYIQKLSLMLDMRIALGTPCYFACAAIHAIQCKMLQCYAVTENTVASPVQSKDEECSAVVSADGAR